ncbi:MAG: c-type cytochrome [Pirellulales bacterium]|nr:c-type cytochrome [Pirellulales bacterium]
MKFAAPTLILVSSLCICCLFVYAEDKPLRPGRLPTELRKALVQGLKLTFTQGEKQDSRPSRLAALYVPADEPPTPFLNAGTFEVEFSGYLKLKLKGQYTFYAEGSGNVTIHLNDAPALSLSGENWSDAKPAVVDLIKGYNKLSINYESPASGGANLRVFWSSEEEGFPKEPLPAELLMHDGRDSQIAAGNILRHGRNLFATRRCAACHDSGDLKGLAATGMPELATDAPALAGVGSRLSPEWLAAWIANPQAMRTHTTMPQMLAGDDKVVAQQAADLSAYLATLTADAPAVVEGDKSLGSKGETLFERLGCVACHTFEEPVISLDEDSDDDADEYDRVTLHYANAKFKPGALAAFLAEPRKHYQWSRMPDFRLTDEEAQALATFIRDQSEGEVEITSKGDAARGEKLFVTAKCAQCHVTKVDGNTIEPAARPLFGNDGTGGCLSPDPKVVATEFHFDDADREALRKFLAVGKESLGRRVPIEFSHRQVKSLRCTSCHQRDTTDADLPYILDEEGVLGETPPIVPSLTWTGEKLHADWAKAFVSGKSSVRPRDWLKIRMPAFPVRGEIIAEGLSCEHGYPADFESALEPVGTEELADVGHKLTLKEGGFNCLQCHGAGETPATSPFEAPGINLALAKDRLRYDYYRRWLLHPLRVDPITKMPKLAPDSRTTGLKEVLDGDAVKQFDAIWHYIQSLGDDSTQP